MSSDAAGWTVSEARRMLRTGALSAEEYLHELRAAQPRPEHLGAFVYDARDDAATAARTADRDHHDGLLAGVPLVVKDNIDVAGVPTTAATAALRGHLPDRSAPVWRRLKRAGALLLAKTSMHELAYGVTGVGSYGPTAKHPTVPGRLPGGSSSGTATAVGAGLAPAGLGTDTGGSVRIPAALCGLVGFRPTTGRYPGQGLVRISPARDTAGVIARSVEDVLLLDQVLAGPRTVLDGSRALGRVLARAGSGAWQDLDPEVARVAEAGLAALRKAGLTVVDPPDGLPSQEELLDAATAVPLAQTRAALERYLAATPGAPNFCEVVRAVTAPDVRALLTPLLDQHPDPRANERATAVRTAMDAAARSCLDRCGAAAWIAPTTVLPAPPADTTDDVTLNGRKTSTFLTYIRTTAPAAVRGWPSITIPAGTTRDGLPVGLQIDAPAGADTALLVLARDCTRALQA